MLLRFAFVNDFFVVAEAPCGFFAFARKLAQAEEEKLVEIFSRREKKKTRSNRLFVHRMLARKNDWPLFKYLEREPRRVFFVLYFLFKRINEHLKSNKFRTGKGLHFDSVAGKLFEFCYCYFNP